MFNLHDQGREAASWLFRDSNKTSFQANIKEWGPVRVQAGASRGLPTLTSKYGCYQKLNFSANWTIRGLELKFRTLPKSAVLMSLTGLSRLGWFNRLKKSA